MQRWLRTYLSVCFHLASMRLCMCTSIIHARLYMQLTACDCLLDVGFPIALISVSHSSRYRLRIILTSAAHILDIGFALTPTTLETQHTLTLQKFPIRFDIGFGLSCYDFAFGLDFLRDIGFAVSWHACDFPS